MSIKNLITSKLRSIKMRLPYSPTEIKKPKYTKVQKIKMLQENLDFINDYGAILVKYRNRIQSAINALTP